VREVSGTASDGDLQQIMLDAGGLADGVYSYSLESNGNKVWNRCIIIK